MILNKAADTGIQSSSMTQLPMSGSSEFKLPVPRKNTERVQPSVHWYPYSCSNWVPAVICFSLVFTFFDKKGLFQIPDLASPDFY